MRAGKMDRYITIQKKVVTTDDYGAQIETWSTRIKVWGQRLNLSMSERIQAQQAEKVISARYRVRYNTDIQVTDRIIDGDDTYEIIGIVEIARRRGHELIGGTI